ncbi:ribosomal protein S18 acetylase RimI-like enzyme [Yoonia maricola]|uniref:Ribosomal protein S18 acetylase RimI-like enzyme n=1 Tax=Yoonia maricola TaxID=420999 RepID=A0A2M8W172_9RHOB|nr:GNAT family N-acetyltransferase [Yoonia maricola]PJI84684.1 ribosomal protein S18 acetylase RimI-like enzyme [Yoonia maricola]
MPDLELRRLTPDDASLLRTLWVDGLQRTPDLFLLTEDELRAISDADFAQRICGAVYLGAFERNILQGFVVFRRGSVERLRHTADIGPLYVVPMMQGRGVGRSLMKAALDWLVNDGVSQVELTLDETNAAALGLYQSLGFQTFGRRPRSVIVADQPRTDLLMMKSLDGFDLGLPGT